MRILVLGNSHVGALMRAWRRVAAEYPAYELAFVASLDEVLGDATTDAAGVVQRVGNRTEGSHLPVSEYDAFILVADLPPPRRIYFDVVQRPLSRAVKEATVSDLVSAALTTHLFERVVRPWSDAPTLVLSQPERRSEERALRYERYCEAVAALSEELARRGATYVAQPRTVLDESCRPRPEFYQDAINIEGALASNQERASIGHLNERGGIHVLRNLLAVATGWSP